jgi:hypothetical protein
MGLEVAVSFVAVERSTADSAPSGSVVADTAGMVADNSRGAWRALCELSRPAELALARHTGYETQLAW